jgi:predicted nucleic acid-binding protein
LREFFDTSVLIAAFWGGHRDHQVSVKLLGAANRRESMCALHSLAEVYAVMTSLPVKPVIPPEQAVLFVQSLRERLTVVALDEPEYWDTIQRTAEMGFTSGRIYDALLLCCAAKMKAKTIYTWNLKHFQAIDPSQASRIRTPEQQRDEV